MKVLEVLDSFYPSIDGPINAIVNIAKTLKSKNLAEVDLLVPKYKEVVEIKGINIYRCASIAGPEGYMICLPNVNIRNLIKNGGYDIVHVHSPFPLGKYAIDVAKKYGIPCLMTVHTKFKSDFERKLKSKLLQKFMLKYIMKPVNKADYVLSVSEGAGETVKEYGYKGENVYIIRNGTDMLPCKPNKKIEEEIIEKYSLKDKVVFLFVGRVVENKNIQFSLEVLKKMLDKGFNKFKFLIVGDGGYLEKLKALVEELGLGDNVVFVGKIMDRALLASYYQVADLFLFPSTFDTCGIVVIEAAANKLASVLIENSCASELIENGKNGLCFPEDPSVWAGALIKIVSDKTRLKVLGEEAFKSVYVKWEDIALLYYKFYLDVLNGNVKKKEDSNV